MPHFKVREIRINDGHYMPAYQKRIKTKNLSFFFTFEHYRRKDVQIVLLSFLFLFFCYFFI